MTATQESINLTIVAARAAAEIKATSIVAIDVSERLVLTDVFLVVSGSTDRQVRSIVDAVERAMHEAGSKRLRREGLDGEAHWVLLDFGDIMVHVQQDEDREFYALEKLWGDCPLIELPEDIEAVPVAEASSLVDYFAPAEDDTFDDDDRFIDADDLADEDFEDDDDHDADARISEVDGDEDIEGRSDR